MTSSRTADTRSVFVMSGRTCKRSGTTLDTMPPERRSSAVVRAVTGRLTATSSRPVIRERYAAKAAMISNAVDESWRSVAASR